MEDTRSFQQGPPCTFILFPVSVQNQGDPRAHAPSLKKDNLSFLPDSFTLGQKQRSAPGLPSLELPGITRSLPGGTTQQSLFPKHIMTDLPVKLSEASAIASDNKSLLKLSLKIRKGHRIRGI